MNILLIGYGNIGRLDDGLGPMLAERIEALALPGVTVDADYQLIVEHGEQASRFETVVFVDACTTGPEPFWVSKIVGNDGRAGFSSHSCSPEGVLAIARDLFGHEPTAYVMGIRGYDFNEYDQRLSDAATSNLDQAVEALERMLREGTIDEIRPEGYEQTRPTDQN